MSIAPTVSSASQTPGGDPGNTLNESNFGLKFDEFLKLLTTQLQNQDPTAPMDSEKLTRQLTQFSTVEQAIRTNSQLARLIDMTRASQILSAADYVGQQVEFRADRIFLPADQDATVSYQLARAAAEVRMRVLGANDEVLAEKLLPATAGSHQEVWDGRNNSGTRLHAGEYRVEIEARDENGRPVPVRLRSLGTVDAVEFDDSGMLLSVDGVLRPVSSVTAIRHTDS